MRTGKPWTKEEERKLVNYFEEGKTAREMRIKDTSFSCMFEDNPNHCPEIYARIRPDREIFSIAKCDYSINDNGSIDDVVEKVKKFI